MAEFQFYLKKFKENKDLNSQDSYEIFSLIADNKVENAEIKDFLITINEIGISENLLFGAAKSLNERSIKITQKFEGKDRFCQGLLDVCGTGGDNSNSLNISTTVAIILASMDIPVAKHGNKAVSSKSGSADIFFELDIDLIQTREEVEKSLKENNLAFIFAPLYHPALKNIAQIRKELGVRTIFNFLGPLLNPAQTQYQLIGCCDQKIAKMMIKTCQLLGKERCMVVTGLDGMDEISISANTVIYKFDKKDGKITEEIFNPEDYGIKKRSAKLIEGKDPKYNADMLIKLLKNGDILDEKLQAYFDIVTINTAAALIISKKSQNFDEAIKMAQKQIKSGKSYQFLKNLKKSKN